MSLNHLVTLCFLGCLTIASPSFAGTYKVPEESRIATVRISDKWKTQKHEEYVETVSPNGTIHVLVLPVEGNKVTEAAGEAIRHIRRHGSIAVKAASVKENKARVKKKELPMLSWDATEHGRPMKVRCYVFSAGDGRRVILMAWGLVAAEEKNREALTRILESVKTE